MSSIRIDSLEKSSIDIASAYLIKKLNKLLAPNTPLIILCIGTDRSTGDSLGPLVGYILNSYELDNIHIYGDLYNPVHAGNLNNIIENINSTFINPYVIAIDASLGSLQDVGKLYIEESPIFPGAALNKDLPSVGNISISGIVNMHGKLEYLILQNTRLYTVMTLATCIAKVIYNAYNEIYLPHNVSRETL